MEESRTFAPKVAATALTHRAKPDWPGRSPNAKAVSCKDSISHGQFWVHFHSQDTYLPTLGADASSYFASETLTPLTAPLTVMYVRRWWRFR